MKQFLIDFHIHSKYAYATSKSMDLQSLGLWAQYKGITILGTGDFTHPVWQQELSDQLIEVEQGLFGLRSDIEKHLNAMMYQSCKGLQRFLLSAEISTIFKRKGRCYRTHSIILAPSFQVVEQLTQKLSMVGNLLHDGRPILGLDVKDLLQIVLDVSDQAILIPAHIWTPWYGLLGSKSGFDSVQDAFEELTPFIYAVEKGLSSSFLMNAQVSQLDQFTILSNSDAHSLQNIGREANIMRTELSYAGIVQALKSKDSKRLIEGIEFFPERGKYYADGHRACNVMWYPEQTKQKNNICTACQLPVTVGVLNRVQQLADRSALQAKAHVRASRNIVPLFDILKHVLHQKLDSKKVMAAYHQLLQSMGNEFYILLDAPIADIALASTPEIAHAIAKIRSAEVAIQPGYDGVYGQVQW